MQMRPQNIATRGYCGISGRASLLSFERDKDILPYCIGIIVRNVGSVEPFHPLAGFPHLDDDAGGGCDAVCRQVDAVQSFLGVDDVSAIRMTPRTVP